MTPSAQTLAHNLRDRRGGFTMIEMLVVVGIIALLISILLPTVTRMQIIGQMAQTNGEIAALAGACHQYYNTYNAFPGPFSNDQIEKQTAAAGVINSTTGAALSGNVTGTENLVLGLLGGLNINTTTGGVVYNSGEVGIGSIVLNSSNPQRMNFFSTGSGTTYKLSNGSFVDGAGNAANDSPIPEFIDYFKNGLPLLYLRARVGAPGIVGYQNNPAAYQYDIAEVIGYTGTKIGGHTHGLLSNVGNFTSPIKTAFPNDAGIYFMNPIVAPTNLANIQATGSPRVTNGFIIISAGPDGIYGNYDDLTSFGALTN